MVEWLNFYFVPGIVLGSIYALGAVGLTLTFGILRFANFAHGEFLTLGAYFTLAFMGLFALSPWLAIWPAMAVATLIVLGIDRCFFRPFRNAQTIILVIASFGMMLMIRSAVQFFWGTDVRAMVPGIQKPVAFFDGALLLSPRHGLIIGVALLMMLALHLLLTHTKTGKAMRALSDSPELARICGINVEYVVAVTWVVSALTAVVAGVLLAIDTHVETRMGFKLLLPIFAATILGGIGRPFGAVAGGLFIGIVEECATYPFMGTQPLLSPGYKPAVAFAVMVVMLIWRPSGLFRGRVHG